MSEIIHPNFVTKNEIPVDDVIRGLADEHDARPFKRLLIIATWDDGEPYYALSDPDAGCAMFDMVTLQHELIIASQGGK